MTKLNLREFEEALQSYAIALDNKVQKKKMSLKDGNRLLLKINDWHVNARKNNLLQVEDEEMSYNRFNVEEEVREIISEMVYVERVKLSYKLEKDLKLTEDDILVLVSELEYRFEIEIYEDDIEKWETVKDVILYVKDNIGGFDE